MELAGKLAELYDRIKLKLGGEYVVVELSPEAFLACLKEAYEVIEPYVNEVRYQTFVPQPKIDLRALGISDIAAVYEAPYGVRDVEFNPLSVYVNATRMNFRSFAERQAMLSEIAAQTRKTFKFEDGFLYLDGYTTNVTVEYFPKFAYETSSDELAVSWVGRYVQALCKEVVGRVRTKFVPENLPVGFDGESLLSEALEEKTRLTNELSEKNYGYTSVRR